MPKGVFASTMIIAAISATLTKKRVSCLFVFIIQFLLVIIPAMQDTIQLRKYYSTAARRQQVQFPDALER